MEWLWTIIGWLLAILFLIALACLAMAMALLIRQVWRYRHRHPLPRVKLLGADDRGILLHRDGGAPTHLPWSDILEIQTFKLDLVTYDDVRLAFITGDESYFEFSEDDSGFAEAMQKMRIAFPSIPEDWFDTVMRPAFATNFCVLWKRERERDRPIASVVPKLARGEPGR